MFSKRILGSHKRVPREAREGRKSLKLNKIFICVLSSKLNYTHT